MTAELDKERMLDAITMLQMATYSKAKQKLGSEGKLNKGTQKALESFYNKLVLKNGTKISRTKVGRIIIQNKKGQFKSSKGLGRFIKQFKQREKK